MTLAAFCVTIWLAGRISAARLNVLENLLDLVELVAELGELHVDLGEFHLGVFLGGDRHLGQAPVLAAGGHLGSCFLADGQVLSPLVDRISDQAADDQDGDDKGNGDRGAHDPPPTSVSLPAVKEAAAAMISLGVSWMVNGVTS